MMKLNEVSAYSVGIKVIWIIGRERSGVAFSVDESRSNAVGAQCGNCNTVVWTNVRDNSILGEVVPSDIPAFGMEYKKYYQEKIVRFLRSMPGCPNCGERIFDRFVNNVNAPRFSDGSTWAADGTIRTELAFDQLIWWLG